MPPPPPRLARDDDGGGGGGGTGGDPDFELLHVEPHAFNRAVLYSSKQLHNAHITPAAERALTCDPARARLTANVFFA